MSKGKQSKSNMNLRPGAVVGSAVVDTYLFIADMAIVWGVDGVTRVFDKSTLDNKAKLYEIEGHPVEEVFVPRDHEIVILQTKKGQYVRNFDNQAIEEARNWSDYYFEPFTASFYRKDRRGNWYDIEGYRLVSPVFIKEGVLCSLPGKTSKKSMAFKEEKVTISPAARLIQVGKMVYNIHLELVHYFGEKITGLGTKNISFGGVDVLQEVFLGLNKRAFINEYSHEPYLINNEEITDHIKTVLKNDHRFEVFKSGSRKYVLENDSKGVFSYEDEPVAVDFNTFITIGNRELIQVKRRREVFYMDINSKEPFTIPDFKNEKVVFIDQEMVQVDGDELFNMKTANHAFVYNENKQEVFTLNEGSVHPEDLMDIEGFEHHYAYAKIEGRQKLFYKKNTYLLELHEEAGWVAEVDSSIQQRLLNAKDQDGRPIVLDARKGYDQLSIAKSEGRKLVEVLGEPHRVGNTFLQNAMLETLGGSEPRVIDLNDEQLSLFTLPENLKEFPEDNTSSGFQGNQLLSLDFENSIQLQEESYLSGEFVCFMNNIHPVMIQQKNGKPLHLEGAGHRNELVTAFNLESLDKKYFMGHHLMVHAKTLTEDLKESEILFSFNTKKTWMPFYDSYLPVCKRVVELRGETDWEYHLFELRGIENIVEYIAIEKNAPHRVLVEKQNGRPIPKIVKSKEKVLKTPEEISAIRRFFLADPGYLLEVD